ncbi:hypothetical protein COBT_001269, partial [Conglomerata obtusa]
MSISKVSMMKTDVDSENTSLVDDKKGYRMSPPAPKQHDYVIKKSSGVYKKKYEKIISTTEKTSTNKRKNPDNPNNKDGCLNENRILSNNLQESVKNFENDNDLNPKNCDGIHQCTTDASILRTEIINEYNVIQNNANQTVDKIKTALNNFESTDICNNTTHKNKIKLIKFLSEELIS